MKPESILKHTEHRPFPLPRGPWFMTQTWNHVLFAHWPLPVEALQNHIPSCLDIDTYEETAWIGILPFFIDQFHARFLPPIPRASSFPELNVRTYVKYRGIPGIYFFSLDAAQLLAVKGARTFFHLPYFYAEMELDRVDRKNIIFTSKREGGGSEILLHYRPVSRPFACKKDTLEYWLTERYRLYTTHKKSLYFQDIHHLQWPLQRAAASFRKNSAISGIELPSVSPILHYADSQKVLFWPMHRIRK
ncbi:YqjF family protein [Fictibacillus terranigra]|uniref:DUF2071 domain-containing protein n=1 Tax=Fictibacillus terranigra TaxID=3058424 RepID=A0ABT8E823_9BACL|nr:DUF2071 domain-containing protein [Fictibacillus sp. CENA-BCM004]MDN4074072.1 DUF2071 domain-containing protein [Fictibacillus sp. CENA-BCM004]